MASRSPPRESDADLLGRFRGGDLSAFTRLVRRWEEAAFRIASRITGDHAAAEDVRQAVFLRVLERSDTIRNPHAFGSWLKRAVVNEAIDVVRNRRRLRETGLPPCDDVTFFPGSDDGKGDATDPRDRFDDSEEASQLREALAGLDAYDRALLSLRFDEELTFQDLADVLGRPVSTVKTQLERAIKRLRTVLRNEAFKDR